MNEKIKWKESLRKYLPEKINFALNLINDDIAYNVEEIRLRASKPLMAYTSEAGFPIPSVKPHVVSIADLDQTFGAITGKSQYAYKDEICQGFLTLESGIRAGIAGNAVVMDGAIKSYKNISGINFRIPTEATGIAARLLQHVVVNEKLVNTLVISSPKLGKTTLVRDIARCAGSGIGMKPCKVSLIDERQELAASRNGVALFEVGRETDIITNVPKHIGVFMALRALSPDVIVTDEIGRDKDLEALREVANSGVTMITTAHAPNLSSLLKRLFFKSIFEERMFDRYVILSAALGRITVEQIHDCDGQNLLIKPILLSSKEKI